MSYEFIGVDNGYGYTKTAHSTFVTSIKSFKKEKPAIMQQVLYYQNEYYIIGGTRKNAIENKTDDEETFLITLAAIGEELKRREKTKAEIILAVGLPLGRCKGKAQKEFREYFLKHSDLSFQYEEVQYDVVIKDVIVSPQCISGVIDLLNNNQLQAPSVVVDIGSWTTDILPIDRDQNGILRPMIEESRSIPIGAIKWMMACKTAIYNDLGKDLQENQIQSVFRGRTDALPQKIVEEIQEIIKKKVEELVQTLGEQYDLDITPFLLMGGGSNIVKRYGGSEYFEDVSYLLNVCANALGYERIAKQLYKTKK